jgi:hypothetical protein
VKSSPQLLIPLEARSDWERALEGTPHAFAHTWTSCKAMSLTTRWPTFLYVWQDGPSRVVCAIAERGDGNEVDVVTPYGFGGFVGHRSGPALLEDWSRFALERGYVCGYLGLNPVLTPSVCRTAPDYREHNDVYVLELGRGLEALHSGLSSNRRRQLRAVESGTAHISHDRDRLAAFFLAEIDEFLRSSGASSTYEFNAATWRTLLGLDDVLLVGAEGADGDLVAACVFAHTPYCAEYLFGVSRSDGRKYSASLIWAGAALLAEKGVPRMNLGGGARRADGIAEFKRRFGGVRLPLGALTQVYRPAEYAALCSAVGRDPADRTGFFPAYRAPVVTPSGAAVPLS